MIELNNIKQRVTIFLFLVSFIILLTSCQEKQARVNENFSQLIKISILKGKRDVLEIGAVKGRVTPVSIAWGTDNLPSKEEQNNVRQCISKRKYITVDIPLMLAGVRESIMMGGMNDIGSLSIFCYLRVDLNNFAGSLQRRGYMQIADDKEILCSSNDVKSVTGGPDYEKNIVLELTVKPEKAKAIFNSKNPVYLYLDGEMYCNIKTTKTASRKEKPGTFSPPFIKDNILYLLISKNDADDLQRCAIIYSGPLTYPLDIEGPRPTRNQDL